MLEVFNGEHENKIDSKARLSIPAAFRRKLETGDPEWETGKNASMYIVYGDDTRNYLEVFTVRDMNKLYSKIQRLGPGSDARKALNKLYGAQSTTATLDETGRIVLSAKLRQKLDLEDMAAVVGNIETFHIWKPETYHNDSLVPSGRDPEFDPKVDPTIYLPGDEV